MDLVEFYYPLATLTNKGNYFSKIDTSKNFAIEKGVSGYASAYYIQSASDFPGLPPSFNINNRNNTVTHYLVIKHKTFYVLFPICNVKSLSNFVRSDITISPIRKSIDNLLISKTGNKIEFDLNLTIDSMKTFAPTSYYVNTNVYVINAPIFVGGKIDESKYAKGIEVKSGNWTKVGATITRVEKISTCKGNIDGKKTDTLFTTKTVTEQKRLLNLNNIYGLSMGAMVLIFYYLFMNYPNVNKHWSSLSIVIFVVWFFIATSVYFSLVFNKIVKNKIDKESLQHTVIFARYSIVAIALMFMTIFSKNLYANMKFVIENNIQDVVLKFKNVFTSNPWVLSMFMSIFAYLIYVSFYIFTVYDVKIQL